MIYVCLWYCLVIAILLLFVCNERRNFTHVIITEIVVNNIDAITEVVFYVELQYLIVVSNTKKVVRTTYFISYRKDEMLLQDCMS